jgi:hypothetical protein
VLYGLARRHPNLRFAAIATSWCTRETQFFLSQHRNIDVFPATPNVELVYAITRVLIAPSLWPEAFGLVALEASARGIPAITSDSAGLLEANPVPSHVVPTPLVWDVNAQRLLRGATQDGALRGDPGGVVDAKADLGKTPKSAELIAFLAERLGKNVSEIKELLTVADGAEVDGYSRHLARLADDGELRRASDATYAAARAYVADRRDLFVDRLALNARDRRRKRAGEPEPAASGRAAVPPQQPASIPRSEPVVAPPPPPAPRPDAKLAKGAAKSRSAPPPPKGGGSFRDFLAARKGAA